MESVITCLVWPSSESASWLLPPALSLSNENAQCSVSGQICRKLIHQLHWIYNMKSLRGKSKPLIELSLSVCVVII